ncbi:MAG: RNA 2',3'-cyclic phosphodiesterase [Salinivirgaceae bacterium]|nr:RNA 2',3'-cyclic phosphodiesterase [Salinivirgaceae bacterium]
MDQEKKRLFIGIPIEDFLLQEFVDFFKVQPYDPKVRWTATENLHITLVFKGNTEYYRITEIKEQISEFLKTKPSFNLNFDKYCTMPLCEPRMVWAKYNVDPIHTLIAEGIAKIMRANIDAKPIPHVTLARFKPEAAHKLIKLDFPLEMKIVKVNKIHLYESILHPEGPEYKILDTYFLA